MKVSPNHVCRALLACSLSVALASSVHAEPVPSEEPVPSDEPVQSEEKDEAEQPPAAAEDAPESDPTQRSDKAPVGDGSPEPGAGSETPPEVEEPSGSAPSSQEGAGATAAVAAEPGAGATAGAAPAVSPESEVTGVPLSPFEGAFSPLEGAETPGAAPEGPGDAVEGLDDSLFEMVGIDVVAVLAEDVYRAPGAVQFIGEEQLAAFDHEDATRVLSQAPGVYVRQEDGYGLRPNVAFRGANADRSKKLTLMQDRVLFGPAPYSAPAAYYFPLTSSMVGVDVVKGPGSIQYGPQTIGGAINLHTRAVPEQGRVGSLRLSGGNTMFGKAVGHIGQGSERWGVLFTGAHIQTDGFKELDGGGDSGFSREEAMLKLRYNNSPEAEHFHRLVLQLGYSREGSNETYLGLTDSDFSRTPLRRYAATALDRMDYWRTQVALKHELAIGSVLELDTTLYRHDFDRRWNRLNSVLEGTTTRSLASLATGLVSGLADTLQERRVYALLTGAPDPEPEDAALSLILVDNQRRYISEGIQTRALMRFYGAELEHQIEIGARLHHDQVDRDHLQRTYTIEAGAMRRDDRDSAIPGGAAATDNLGRSLALALYGAHEVTWRGMTVTPSFRGELIHASLRDDLLGGNSVTRRDLVLLWGLGLYQDLTDRLGLLAGVHKGFSPTMPALGENEVGEIIDVAADPEEVVNVEAGLRYRKGGSHGQVVGFVSEYQNIVADCAASAGCDLDLVDRQFNGGAARVSGIEASFAHDFSAAGQISIPVRLVYTYTHARFLSDFDSPSPQWGEVRQGDALPYVAPHQGSVQMGVHVFNWRGSERVSWLGADLSVGFVDEMREQAGSGPPGPGELPFTDQTLMIDAVTFYRPVHWLKVFIRGDNLTNARPIVARRPAGARPSKPLLVQGGLQVDI